MSPIATICSSHCKIQRAKTLFRSAGQFIKLDKLNYNYIPFLNNKNKIHNYFLPPRAKRYPKGQIKFDIKNNMERNLPLRDTWIVHATTKWHYPLFTSYSFPLLCWNDIINNSLRDNYVQMQRKSLNIS